VASIRISKNIQQGKKLPFVLSYEDVIHIFESVNNIKHKAILVLAYSAGLRMQDIDTKRLSTPCVIILLLIF